MLPARPGSFPPPALEQASSHCALSRGRGSHGEDAGGEAIVIGTLHSRHTAFTRMFSDSLLCWEEKNKMI